MKKYWFLLMIYCGMFIEAKAQNESYRGGVADGNANSSLINFNPYGSILMYSPFWGSIADGYGHDSLINHPQYAVINMFSPFRGNIGDGYAHDSLISFAQRGYIAMYMPYGGGIADGWTSYPIFNIVVLPVELMNFSGLQQGKQHLLNWQTSQEQNSARFEIERSSNGSVFSTIGSTPAAGNSSSVKNYDFADDQPMLGNNFYRLKMIDLDGTFKYSNIILLKQLANASMLAIYPNPTTQVLNISLSGPNDNSVVQATIFNASGKLVQAVNWQKNNNIQKIDVSQLVPGVYMLRLINKEENTVWRFIKQ